MCSYFFPASLLWSLQNIISSMYKILNIYHILLVLNNIIIVFNNEIMEILSFSRQKKKKKNYFNTNREATTTSTKKKENNFLNDIFSLSDVYIFDSLNLVLDHIFYFPFNNDCNFSQRFFCSEMHEIV